MIPPPGAAGGIGRVLSAALLVAASFACMAGIVLLANTWRWGAPGAIGGAALLVGGGTAAVIVFRRSSPGGKPFD